MPDREAGGIGGRIGFCRRSGRSDGPAGCRPKRYGQPCQADFPAIFHIEDKINITIRNANFPLGRGALSPLTDFPFQEKPSLGRVGPESEPDIPSPLEMRTDGGYGIPPSVAHQGKPTLRGSLCAVSYTHLDVYKRQLLLEVRDEETNETRNKNRRTRRNVPHRMDSKDGHTEPAVLPLLLS